MIETSRLLLREMRAEDAGALLGIFGDPVVMDCFGVSPFGPDQMERWVDRNLEHQRVHGFGLFSVVRKSDGIVIGDCGLEVMEAEVELGYDFRSDCWNLGYATEAACAVRDYAFGTLGLPRLISLIRAGNLASRRVAEKVGMSLEREEIRHGVSYWVMGLGSSVCTQPMCVRWKRKL